jgi:hypothetical protein
MPSTTAAPRPRALIAHPDSEVRGLLGRLLFSLGFAPLEVADVAEAARLLRDADHAFALAVVAPDCADEVRSAAPGLPCFPVGGPLTLRQLDGAIRSLPAARP